MTELSLENPCWRYHAKHGAKLITTQAELDAAHASGWRDSPGAATALALAAVAEPVIEVVEALEAAEDLIIEKVQAAVSRKRKSKT